MKVTTIDGGFRGLGSLSTDQRISAAERFSAQLGAFYSTRTRFRVQAAAGVLPQGDVVALETEFRAVEDAINTHLARLDQLSSAAALAEWRSGADQLLTRAREIARRAVIIAQDEDVTRGWKIGLSVAGAIAFVAGVWWFTSSR